MRRAGELLKQVNGKGNNQPTDGGDSKFVQSELARQAGMSERQQVTAVQRVFGRVPSDKSDKRGQKGASVANVAIVAASVGWPPRLRALTVRWFRMTGMIR